jgi:hypothetical protein
MHVPIIGSIDSFIAAALMAAAGCPKSWQQRAVAGFAAFDMLAGLAGSELGARVAASAIAPAIVLAALILVCARKYPVLFLLLPALLCFDNLALGPADGGATFWSAALDGLWSGTLAICGFAAVAGAARLTRYLCFA